MQKMKLFIMMFSSLVFAGQALAFPPDNNSHSNNSGYRTSHSSNYTSTSQNSSISAKKPTSSGYFPLRSDIRDSRPAHHSGNTTNQRSNNPH